MENDIPGRKLSTSYKTKRTVVQTSLLALATAFEILSKSSEELRAEIDEWEDGRVFALNVLAYGPAVTMKKEAGRIKFLGKGLKENPELVIHFKNMDSAILPLTGRMGAHIAFVQHRAILHGDVGKAMQINRAMNIVQKYLMPGMVLKRTSRRPPKYTFSQRMLKARVMATLGIGLAMNARR